MLWGEEEQSRKHVFNASCAVSHPPRRVGVQGPRRGRRAAWAPTATPRQPGAGCAAPSTAWGNAAPVELAGSLQKCLPLCLPHGQSNLVGSACWCAIYGGAWVLATMTSAPSFATWQMEGAQGDERRRHRKQSTQGCRRTQQRGFRPKELTLDCTRAYQIA